MRKSYFFLAGTQIPIEIKIEIQIEMQKGGRQGGDHLRVPASAAAFFVPSATSATAAMTRFDCLP